MNHTFAVKTKSTTLKYCVVLLCVLSGLGLILNECNQ